MIAPGDTIVGRELELAAIQRLLTDDGPSVLVLTGEPGIGKTTLWSEGIARAHASGYRVLGARPAETESRLSYAGLADVVAGAYDEVRDVLPEPQRRALEIALLRAEGRTEARTTGTGVHSILGALAEAGPVLVAIDDLQWLDPASMRALEFAARRLPPAARVLAARRPAPDGPTFAGPDVASLELGPLSLAALHHVLAAALGAAPPRPLLARIAETSGGNPFFAIEIARSLGEVSEVGGRLPVPAPLHDLLAGRLKRLSPDARAAALVAAALSRPTVAAVGASPAALAEAEAAGVLAVERDRIRFTHPLLASAVYGAEPGAARLELHRRLAESTADPDERAVHLALSVTGPDPDAAAELDAAAARAARRGAQDAAADLYRSARRLGASNDHEGRARRLRLEAAALHAAGSPDEARRLAEHAVEVAPPGPERAEALLQLSQISWVAPGELDPLDALRLALAEAGDDRALRGRIHAKLGMYSDRDQRQAVEHADAAAALLDDESDPGLLAYVLLARLFFGAQTGHGVDERLLARALELEERAGPDAERSSLVLIWHQNVDDHEAARARHRLEDEWYRDRGDEIWRAEKRSHLAVVEFRAGNWDLAYRLVEQSCAELEPVGSEGPLGMPFWTRASFDAHMGRIAEARAAVAPLLAAASGRGGSAWFSTFSLEALGFAALSEGEYDAADAAFTETEELFESMHVSVPLATRTDADHVEAVVGLGDLDRARRLVARFEQRAASVPLPWSVQALPRAKALLLAAEGDVGGALTTLEHGPVVDALPFDRARNLLVLGTLRRRLKQRRAAAATLDEALATFERLGAPAWAARARSERARVGLRRGDRGELTQSERRIAELAASGLTNAEVAKAAFVSPKTVEANLARVYRKLGIRSRAELGAAMGSRAET